MLHSGLIMAATGLSLAAALVLAPLNAWAATDVPLIWHLLADPQARFHDLGPDHHDTRYHQRHQHTLIRQLERITGQRVTLTPTEQTAAA